MTFLIAIGIFVLVTVAHGGVSMDNPFFCYTTDPIRSMTNMHSTSTSYEAIRRFNFTTVNPYISTCTPSKFWYLGRYGGRFPSATLMRQMIDFAESSIQDDIERNYNAGRTTLCRQDFEAIRNWTRGANFDLINAGRTTEAGVIAMRNIADRFQQVFPDILPETYNRDHFHFRCTGDELTSTSIRSFANGLFGPEADVVYEDVPERDWFMRPMDFCPDFWVEIEDWNVRRQAFRDGPEFEEMFRAVNRKLGFTSSNALSPNSIYLMWEWCKFETASRFELSGSETGEDSVWCAPLSVANQLLWEYFEDLGHFYFSGYGVRNQRLLENLNCGLMQDLLISIESTNDDDTVARIFVSYVQELQAMLVSLGTFRDTWPLHQHNYAQQSGRNWLTSLISPLAANLAVIRYECDDDNDDDLVFLLNERPILVPGCDRSTGVCKASVFLNQFRRFIEANCEELFCSSN